MQRPHKIVGCCGRAFEAGQAAEEAAIVIRGYNEAMSEVQNSKGSWSPDGHKVTQQADNSPRKSCLANLVLHRGDRKYFVNFLSLPSSERHCRKCVKRANGSGEELLEAGGE